MFVKRIEKTLGVEDMVKVCGAGELITQSNVAREFVRDCEYVLKG